jgi:hypothetical protein
MVLVLPALSYLICSSEQHSFEKYNYEAALKDTSCVSYYVLPLQYRVLKHTKFTQFVLFEMLFRSKICDRPLSNNMAKRDQ